MTCNTRFRFGAFLLALCLVAGCGSSGGTSANVAGTLSEQNAEAVATDGMSAVSFLMQMAGFAEGATDAIENPSAQTNICNSGNASIQINDGGVQGQLDAGDYVYANFQACQLDLGGTIATLNGGLRVSVTSASGTDPGVHDIQLYVQYISLTMSISGVTIVIDGNLNVGSSSSDGVTVVSTVSTQRFSAFVLAGQASWSGTLYNVAVSYTEDTSSGAYSMDLALTYSSSAAAGFVTITTTTPFTGPDAFTDPSSGVMEVTGAGDTVITFTALDSINVQLEVDVDGDGTPEATINTTWNFLQGEQP